MVVTGIKTYLIYGQYYWLFNIMRFCIQKEKFYRLLLDHGLIRKSFFGVRFPTQPKKNIGVMGGDRCKKNNLIN